MSKISTSIYLDKRRKKKNDLYPVKLRVYYNGDRRLYNTNIELTVSDFEKSYLAKKPRDTYKELKIKLVAIESKAIDIIDKLRSFSFEQFEKRMFRRLQDANNVIYHYQQYIEQLRDEKRVRTAENYEQSLKSITAFYDKGRKKPASIVPFEQVSVSFLNQYENWMMEEGKSPTSVGFYIRPLRAIFNIAIEAGDIEKDIYPFGKRKYKIPSGKNVKKALDKEQLKALYEAELEEGSFMAKARDYWFFSYQCNGINFRDIAELRKKNIQEDKIIFLRNKTKNTTKENSKPIVIPITSNVRAFLDKYSNKTVSPEDYVFPILKFNSSETQKVNTVKNFIRFINQHMKKLAKEVGITEEISTNWARHSFTTMGMRNGATMEYMQESLGHNNIKTTMNYWAGFEDKVKKDIAEGLMNFD